MSLIQRVFFNQILGSENGPLWKDYFEGGATWAFDVGSQSMTCPIIVEDLERPRQMLVEVNDSAIAGSFNSYYCQCMHIADGVASVDAL